VKRKELCTNENTSAAKLGTVSEKTNAVSDCVLVHKDNDIPPRTFDLP
jgi:hypothetical protein